LKASADLVIIDPSYTFATPVLGGQFNVNVAGIVGRSTGEISGTLTASAGPFVATRQGSISDSLTALGDLIPQVSLRWNSGVNNWMVYGMGDIPVGNYNSSNLANLGIGHGAADGGAGYTYFDPKAGHEFSTRCSERTDRYDGCAFSIKAAATAPLRCASRPQYSRPIVLAVLHARVLSRRR
jgi:hypothetical protein